MQLTLEETDFIKVLVRYYNEEFYKHVDKHKADSILLTNVVATPNVDINGMLDNFKFDFNTAMHNARTVFKELIEFALKNTFLKKSKHLFVSTQFFEGNFTTQQLTFTSLTDVLNKTFTDYFQYIFNNSWQIVHFKGLSIGMKYDSYRKQILWLSEFPEVKGAFGNLFSK